MKLTIGCHWRDRSFGLLHLEASYERQRESENKEYCHSRGYPQKRSEKVKFKIVGVNPTKLHVFFRFLIFAVKLQCLWNNFFSNSKIQRNIELQDQIWIKSYLQCNLFNVVTLGPGIFYVKKLYFERDYIKWGL